MSCFISFQKHKGDKSKEKKEKRKQVPTSLDFHQNTAIYGMAYVDTCQSNVRV